MNVLWSQTPSTHIPSCHTGGLLWLRELHRSHCWERPNELPFQPRDGDDPSGIHDVSSCGVSHDDPAMPTGAEHPSL